jgi:hypothetical protein
MAGICSRLNGHILLVRSRELATNRSRGVWRSPAGSALAETEAKIPAAGRSSRHGIEGSNPPGESDRHASTPKLPAAAGGLAA